LRSPLLLAEGPYALAGLEALTFRHWHQICYGCQVGPKDMERAIVTKEIFDYEMGRANTFAYLGERICYWEGYQRGLRRAYYGEVFGSQEEHKRWMSFAGDYKVDEFQRERGRGYLDGLLAHPRHLVPGTGGRGWL
jgi:hypothetical protein